MMGFGLLKTWISLLTSLAVMAAYLPAMAEESTAENASAAENTAITVYLDEDFNSYATGALPDLATVISDNTSIRVEELPSAEDKSVALEGDANNALIQSSFDTILSGQFFIQADLRFDSVNSSTLSVEMRSEAGVSFVPIRISNGVMSLYDGTTLAKYIEEKFYTLSIGMDMDAKTINVWVDGRHVARDVSFAQYDISDLWFVRYQMSFAGQSKVNIDNLYVRSGSTLEVGSSADGEETVVVKGSVSVEEKMRDAVAFYEYRPYAMVEGKQKEIAAEPFMESDVLYIPIRDAMNAFGAEVTYDAESDSVTVLANGQQYTLKDGADDGSGYPVIVKDDRMMVSAQAVCAMLGKYLFEDKSNGFVIISDQENFISWDEDRDLLNEIVAGFIYTDYTGEELIAMLKEQNPNNAHPRIMADADKFAELRELVKTDPVMQKAYADVVAAADANLTQSISIYEKSDGLRLLPVSRRVLDRVAQLSLVYQISGDERYAERAWMELYVASLFPDWNEYHFLDVAEMSAAFAIGYDWLYDYLNEDQRAQLRTAMVNFGLTQIMDDYNDVPERNRTYRWSVADPPNNWVFVCNGGLAMAALAIADDDPEIEALCGEVLANGLQNIRRALSLFAPSGSYSEGSNYWNYATRYYCFYMSSLEQALGSDMGIFDVPGMKNTVEFVQSLNGPAGYYNFSDAGEVDGTMNVAQFMWYADKLDKAYLADARIDKISDEASTAGWEDMIYYSAELGSDDTEMPLDKYSDIVETMTMRSSYNDDALYVGFHNGWNGESHSHLDLGGYIIDSQGERFIMDLGYDDYNLSGSQWDRYRYRAEGHNTLVINPDAEPDQRVDATAKIIKYESKDAGAYAIADLTEAYADSEEMKRGVMLCEGRTAVLVQDEIKLAESGEVYWFAHTDGEITLLDNGKSAVIEKNGKQMRVELLSDLGTFEVMDAKPLPTSPVVNGQNANEGITKLAIHLTDFTEGTIAVGYSNYYDNYTFGSLMPLDDWTISDTEPEFAELSQILIDGQPLADFQPDVYNYTVALPAGTTQVSTVSANGEILDLRETGNPTGSVVIEAARTAGQIPRSYTVTFEAEHEIGLPEGRPVLAVRSYEANDVPQPENSDAMAFDKNLETRWAVDQHGIMDIDLGSVQPVYGVALALWQGNARMTELNIEISEDGETYTSIFEGMSNGTTEDYEVFPAYGKNARYIRVQCFGTTVGTWNSILEIAVIGE